MKLRCTAMTSIDRLVTGLILLVLVLFTTKEAKAEGWDATDKVLFGTFVGLQIVDTAQTNYIHKHPDQYYETNPIFGHDPNMVAVVGFKAAVTGLIYYAVKDSSSADRKLILGSVVVFEAVVVSHNYHIGVKVAW